MEILEKIEEILKRNWLSFTLWLLGCLGIGLSVDLIQKIDTQLALLVLVSWIFLTFGFIFNKK